jgi:hypothetical protein
VKPGADLEVMLRSNVKECKKLTKKDILIIWGGTKMLVKMNLKRACHAFGNSYK